MTYTEGWICERFAQYISDLYRGFVKLIDCIIISANTMCVGEEIPIPEDTEQKMPGDKPERPVSTRYHLRGIVVHSGQASGGHYYSFIRMR